MAPRRNDERFREEILVAAARLIAERGYHAVRVADIAAACNASSGSVHYWFASKDAVLTAALRHATERALARQSAPLRETEDARERLLRLIEMQLPQGREVRGEWTIWLQYWAEAAVRPELRELHDELYARWRETIVQIVLSGQRQGSFRALDAEAASWHLTALLDGAATQVIAGVSGATPERMRALLRAYVDEQLAAVPGG